MIGLVLALALAAPPASAGPLDLIVVAAPAPRRPGAIVPDADLARMRGGVRLPNGLVVSLGIDIQTRVDGVLVLHSLYASDGPTAGIRVFTDGTDSPRTAPATTTVATANSPAVPLLIVDRSPAGTTLQPGRAVPATTVNLVNGDPATWADAAGQIPVPVRENGPAVAAAPGSISLRNDGSGAVVTLDAPMLQIRQLIGQATGTVVANTGNDRTVDTVTSVNVDLRGLSPLLTSGMFAVQRLVSDARVR